MDGSRIHTSFHTCPRPYNTFFTLYRRNPKGKKGRTDGQVVAQVGTTQNTIRTSPASNITKYPSTPSAFPLLSPPRTDTTVLPYIFSWTAYQLRPRTPNAQKIKTEVVPYLYVILSRKKEKRKKKKTKLFSSTHPVQNTCALHHPLRSSRSLLVSAPDSHWCQLRGAAGR